MMLSNKYVVIDENGVVGVVGNFYECSDAAKLLADKLNTGCSIYKLIECATYTKRDPNG